MKIKIKRSSSGLEATFPLGHFDKVVRLICAFQDEYGTDISIKSIYRVEVDSTYSCIFAVPNNDIEPLAKYIIKFNNKQ